MAEYIIPVVMGMIGGVVSWVTTNFVGHQVTRFYRLKDEIHSCRPKLLQFFESCVEAAKIKGAAP